MLLQTALYLSSVLSAIALIALILIQDRPASVGQRVRLASPRALGRATSWSAAIFLLSALGTAVADGATSGSLLDELPDAVLAVGSVDLDLQVVDAQ